MKADKKDLLRIAWMAVTNGAPWPFAPEVVFAPPRRWRIDWYSESHKLAIEVEGVVYGGHGRHQTATGLGNDCEKYNAIAEQGLALLRYTPKMIQSDPHGVVMQILRVAERKQ